jgi:hypothetical protein
MKEKVFLMKFVKPLTREQEKFLIGQLQVVMEQAQKKLMKTANKLKGGHVKFIAKTSGIPIHALEFSANRIDNMARNILNNFQLEDLSKNKTVYRFAYKIENTNLTEFKFLGKEFKGNLLDDKRITNYFNKQIFPLMRIQPGDVVLTVSEVDL